MTPSLATRLARFKRTWMGALVLGCMATQVPALAQTAAASAERKQVPGYQVLQVGAMRVTALFDGIVHLETSMLQGLSAEQLAAVLRHRYVPQAHGGLQTSVNAHLFEVGGRRVLIDAGTAHCVFSEDEGLGQVPGNLRAAGWKPEEVDDVLITHVHPDHACGAVNKDGTAAFPRATLWMAEDEREFWERPELKDLMPAKYKHVVDQALSVINAYRTAGRFKAFKPGDALPAGIEPIPTLGHTPGHTSYLVSDGQGQKMLVLGDVVHYPAIQLPRPEARYLIDVDMPLAMKSRQAVLARVAKEGWWMAAPHFPFPGVGHVRAEKKGYEWVPAHFTPLSQR